MNTASGFPLVGAGRAGHDPLWRSRSALIDPAGQMHRAPHAAPAAAKG